MAGLNCWKLSKHCSLAILLTFWHFLALKSQPFEARFDWRRYYFFNSLVMWVRPLQISMNRSKTVVFERMIISFSKLVHRINYGTVQIRAKLLKDIFLHYSVTNFHYQNTCRQIDRKLCILRQTFRKLFIYFFALILFPYFSICTMKNFVYIPLCT